MPHSISSINWGYKTRYLDSLSDPVMQFRSKTSTSFISPFVWNDMFTSDLNPKYWWSNTDG